MHKDRKKLIRELLQQTDEEFNNEELLHRLIEEKMTTKSGSDKLTFGEKCSDAAARFTGSWIFIFSFLGTMVAWMILNIFLSEKAFDAFPFILLNLLLSCIAAIQAPLIMMSENRQDAKDRERSENDYRVNLKSELVIDDLHFKIDILLANQKEMLRLLHEEEKERRAELNTAKAVRPAEGEKQAEPAQPELPVL